MYSSCCLAFMVFTVLFLRVSAESKLTTVLQALIGIRNSYYVIEDLLDYLSHALYSASSLACHFCLDQTRKRLFLGVKKPCLV